MTTFAAVDLGATSGRVVNVHVDREEIAVDVVRRFPTPTVAGPGGALMWDFDALLTEIRLRGYEFHAAVSRQLSAGPVSRDSLRAES